MKITYQYMKENNFTWSFENFVFYTKV